MRVRLNDDEEVVRAVKEGLRRTGGYCPCRRQRTEDYKCICKEFRDQIKDENFEGYCHCMLYYKEKIKKLFSGNGRELFLFCIATRQFF